MVKFAVRKIAQAETQGSHHKNYEGKNRLFFIENQVILESVHMEFEFVKFVKFIKFIKFIKAAT